MTNWDTIQLRITEKERRRIERFKWENGFLDNAEFLRRAIEDLIGLSFADSTRNKTTLPEYYLGIHDFYQACKAELDLSEKNKTKIDKLFKEKHSSILIENSRQVNAKLKLIGGNFWNAFRKHEKVGRPKSPKPPRRKPKN